MTVEVFFNLLVEELKINENLRGYYRFLNNPKLFNFRKAYFCQRLQYVIDNIPENKNINIFDIGCGYGTTAIFLAINGYKVTGSTLEYYFEQIKTRLDYWSAYGDMSNVDLRYENLFDNPLTKNNFDVIITMDVLHHLEPLNDALFIIANSLKSNGILIACEENGNNLINSSRLFVKRGNKRIIEFYDETLKKNIKMGNENIRNLVKWKNELLKANLKINNSTICYLRYYFPAKYKKLSIEEIITKEQSISKSNNFLKQYFFHGLNFVASK
ncbi:MAG: methyltransferase domain-containing protein [Bacteroidia bacterium]|nr:methyltransferase domain-containing protein [Bacteroidia bacterium]